MFSISHGRYFLYSQPTDMRKSFDGLCGIITSKMNQHAMRGDLFIFINKKRNRLKMLRWETGGFVLFYKRLEKGTFKWPSSAQGETLNVDERQLRWLLDGLTLVQSEAYRPVDERIIV